MIVHGGLNVFRKMLVMVMPKIEPIESFRQIAGCAGVDFCRNPRHTAHQLAGGHAKGAACVLAALAVHFGGWLVVLAGESVFKIAE